jgi:hypothetical protein
MSVIKTLSLTNGKQLLDLNGSSVNFDLTFSAKSLDNSPFDAIVVDQATLDSNVNLDFQRATDGIISANIVSDKNVYQNYYLCLKSDKPCQVEVVIDKKEINANLPSPQSPLPLSSQSPSSLPHLRLPAKPSNTNWMLIGIIIIIFSLFGGYYYYYIYKKKKKIEDEDTLSSHKIFDTITQSPSPPPPQYQPRYQDTENKTNFSKRLAALLKNDA